MLPETCMVCVYQIPVFPYALRTGEKRPGARTVFAAFQRTKGDLYEARRDFP